MGRRANVKGGVVGRQTEENDEKVFGRALLNPKCS